MNEHVHIFQANLRFPVIVKSDYAAGVQGSHRMSVLFSMGHVDELEFDHPLLIQVVYVSIRMGRRFDVCVCVCVCAK